MRQSFEAEHTQCTVLIRLDRHQMCTIPTILIASQSEEVKKDEVLSFPTNCDQCQSPAETRMKMTSIPHFKEVVIMATNCEVCGARTNEVKVIGDFLVYPFT